MWNGYKLGYMFVFLIKKVLSLWVFNMRSSGNNSYFR